MNLTDYERRWARTLLIIYPRTKRILQALSDSRMRIAQDGFSCCDVERLVEKVSSLNYRMQGIQNLYVLTKNALRLIGENYAEILILRHVKLVSIPDLAKMLNTSVRNVYRRYDKALAVFFNRITAEGFGTAWLEREYEDDKLVAGIFKRSEGRLFSEGKRAQKSAPAAPAEHDKRPNAKAPGSFVAAHSLASKSSNMLRPTASPYLP